MSKIQLPSTLPIASIIIVNYNGRRLLQTCLESLQKLNYPREKVDVILVDNVSTDGSVEFVREKFPFVRVVEMDKNYGQMPAINRCVKYAKGDAIVVLDNDTVVNENWLLELVKVAYSDEKIGICGSKVLYMDAPNIIQFAGGYLHILGGALSQHYSEEDNLHQTISPTGYVIGCSMLIKKDVFLLLEGFDDDYYMYGEEGDLCWRAWIYGYSVMYNPNSIVYHVGGASRKDKLVKGMDYELKRGYLEARLISETIMFNGNKNANFTLLKNLDARNVPSALFSSFGYMIAQLFILLIDKKGKATGLLIKSYWWSIANFGLIWKKRLKIQRERSVSDDVLIRNDVLLPPSRILRIVLRYVKTLGARNS